MHWKTKAACFRVLDILPLGKQLHFWAQRNITKTWPRSAEDVSSLVGVAKKAVSDFEQLSEKPLRDAIFFEIGAGRDLAVPVALRLLGVKQVITTDIDRLARLDLVNSAAQIVANILSLPSPQFSSWDDLEKFGVCYSAPFDAATEKLPQMDAFITNEVLEHVPPIALKEIFINVSRYMRAGGVNLHSIDYSDHYARDGGVSRHNFLQFSNSEWRPYNAGMHYVNRLRHSEYIEIIQQNGVKIVDADCYSQDLPNDLKLSNDFSKFDIEDLRKLRSRIRGIHR